MASGLTLIILTWTNSSAALCQHGMFRATINHCISVYAVTVIGLGNVYRLSYDNVDSELLQWVMISLCGRY